MAGKWKNKSNLHDLVRHCQDPAFSRQVLRFPSTAFAVALFDFTIVQQEFAKL